MAPKTRGKRKDYAAMEAGGEVPEADTGAAEQPRPKARRRSRKVRGPGAPEAAPSGAFAPAPAAEGDIAADQDTTMPAITADAVDLLLQMDGEFGTSDILQPVLEVSALFESKRYILNPYEGDFMDDDYAYWSPQYGYEYTLKLWDGADTIAGKLSIELNHLVHDPLNSGRRIKLTQWRMESLGGSQKQLVILGVEVLGPAKTLSARAEEALSVVLVTAGLSDFQKLAGFAMASKSLHKVVSSDMTPWRLTAACMTAAGEPPPLPEGWTELSDDDGNKFYYHAGRNQTTTRRPMDYMFEMDYNPLGIRLTKTKANAILKLGAKDLKPGTWVDNISFIEHTLTSAKSSKHKGEVAHLYDATDLIQIATKKFKKNGGLSKSVSMANRRYKKHLFADLQGAKSAERTYKLRMGRDLKKVRKLVKGFDATYIAKVKAVIQELEEQLLE